MIALMIGFVIGGWFGFGVAAVLAAGKDDGPMENGWSCCHKCRATIEHEER